MGITTNRNDVIVKKQFFRMMVPATLSMVAISLNEFADSIVVASLLGSNAMSMVNLGMPVMLCFAIIYMLIGTGGSVLYANNLGKLQKKEAGEVLSLSITMSAILGILIMAVGCIFVSPIAMFLCTEKSFLTSFVSYVRVLFLSSFLIILVQTVICFLPAAGSPRLATVINLIANVVNIICDYIYIHFFGMDVAGAALATLTGYVVGAVFLIIRIITGKCRMSIAPFTRQTFKMIPELLSGGVSTASNQLGFSVKIFYCELVAGTLAGVAGITAFSGCFQSISVISVLMGGIANAMIPLMIVMSVQKDFMGIKLLGKRILWMQFWINLIFTMILMIFPEIITTMYSITEPIAYSMTKEAVRIFSLMFVPRGFLMIAMCSFLAVGKKKYSFVISLFEGILGIVPLVFLLTKLWGIDGLWIAYPACEVLILAAMFIYNSLSVKASGDNLSVFWLLPKDNPKDSVLDISVKEYIGQTGAVAQTVFDYCKKYGINSEKTNIIAVACEEMFVYTTVNAPNHITEIDIRIMIDDDKLVIFIKSIGRPFDHYATAQKEEFGNLWMIKKIVTEVSYDYLMGVNQSKLVIDR